MKQYLAVLFEANKGCICWEWDQIKSDCGEIGNRQGKGGGVSVEAQGDGRKKMDKLWHKLLGR